LRSSSPSDDVVGRRASAIVRALHRAATKAFPDLHSLVQTVRTIPMVVADETGCGPGVLWCWRAYTTPDTTV